MPQQRSMPPFLAQNWKAQTNRLSSQGLVAQTTGSFKNRTNHVSFPLRITLGIAYLMLYCSKGLPLPPPSLAGSGQLRRDRRHKATSNLVLLCSELSSMSFWKPRPQILESRRTIPVFGRTDLYQNVTGRRWFFSDMLSMVLLARLVTSTFFNGVGDVFSTSAYDFLSP